MFDLITIGDSTLDTIIVLDEASLSCGISEEHCQLCLNYAEKIPITHSEQSPGGNAPNVAAGVSQLGLKTIIVTELGNDPSGKTLKNELTKRGVNTSLVKFIKKNNTSYGIVLTFKGERTILTCRAKRNYILPPLPATRWIYYTSLGKSFEKLQKKLLAHLDKNPEIKLAINPGSHQMRYGLETVRLMLPRTDILFCNKEEAAIIIGKKLTIKETISALHQKGVKTVSITDGRHGSYTSDGQTVYHLSTYPVPVISKTGAGDSYTSGFLSAIIMGKTIPEAMQWGTANACAVIQKFGAQSNLLKPDGIKKMIKKFSTIVPKII
jgi:sugar/nucleoside kinase (ribokinase family)